MTVFTSLLLAAAVSVAVVAGNSHTGNSIWQSVCPNIAPGKVKVCMDWDDSCFTDFRLAELCRKYKAKVTFNITPREHTDHCVMQRETTERNGTTYHFKSPENFDRAEAVSIPYLTNKDFRYCYEGFKIAAHLNMRYEDTPEDLAFSRKLMEEFLSIAPGVTGQDGFGIVWSRGGKSPGIIKMAKELGFRYCRGPNAYENPGRWGEWAIQPTTYWSEPPEKFWEWYELAKRRGDVFWFWGHTQDLGYDDAIWARLEGIIKRISEDPDAEWIDVGDLAKENKEGSEQRTMCNPLPIEDYPLGVHCRGLANGTVPEREVETWLTPDGKTQQFRELADPALLCVGQSWYLYPSAEMCYRSDDGGASWKHISLHMSGSDGDADLVGYAPTIVAHRDEYLLAGSNGFVFRSKSPEGPFVRLGHLDLPGGMVDGESIPFFWDPCFFSDDDGRLYLYWGCTPTNGIWGCELDASDPLKVVSAPKKLIAFEPDSQPWEIAPNKKPLAAYLEGAWMVKHDGKYILTYSAAGTENKEYAMGQAVGTSPLGSFVKPKDNPFLRKTTGLVTGTSHGAVAKGPDGAYWVVYTIRASTVHWFERRIGMDRIRFNADGSIAAISPSEVPQFVAGAGVGGPGWKRLSGKVPSDAVSAVDDDLSTFWTASKLPADLVVEFGETKEVRAFRLIWRDGGLDTERGVKRGPFRYRVEALDVEGAWQTLVDASANSRDLLVDYRETPTVKTRSVRLTVLGGPKGIVPQVVDFAPFGE